MNALQLFDAVLGRRTNDRLSDGRELVMGIVEEQLPAQCMAHIRALLVDKAPQYYTHFDEYVKNGRNGCEEGLEWRFHLAFLDGNLAGNICTWEHDGLGILGHVYTSPAARGLGIAGRLTEQVVSDFGARGGRAMELNTGPGTSAHRIYSRHGFRDLPHLPGAMIHTPRNSAHDWFTPSGSLRAVPFRWRHWPSLNLLTLDGAPGIRSVGLCIYGPGNMEAPLIAIKAREAAGTLTHALFRVLEDERGTAFGIAGIMPDPNFGNASPYRLFDVYSHPTVRASEEELALECLRHAETPLIHYRTHDADWLTGVGFRQTGVVPSALLGRDIHIWTR